MVRAPCYDKNGIKKGAWSEDEDNKLKAYIEKYSHSNWREVPKFAGIYTFMNYDSLQFQFPFSFLVSNFIYRFAYIIRICLGLSRCGKSCRLRWMNYLRPNVKHGNFTKEEEDVITSLHNKLGNK